ncbi:hypothetical protein ATO4_19834 [Aurantimonas sp. 22II-16-19i]|nr:hypothetical protein ATO4_19834 [Aurantimonas sp. 22II-16-19i]
MREIGPVGSFAILGHRTADQLYQVGMQISKTRVISVHSLGGRLLAGRAINCIFIKIERSFPVFAVGFWIFRL